MEWFWGLKHWLALLGDTLLMAYVGTLVGATGGFLLGLLSAGNIVPSAPLRWTVKRCAEFCRTVPEIVFALVFVIAFGLARCPACSPSRCTRWARWGNDCLRWWRIST